MHIIPPRNTMTSAIELIDWKSKADAACLRVPPLWPIKDFVAVNPFVGLADMHFAAASSLMQKINHGGMLLKADYFREQFQKGRITQLDLQGAITLAQQSLPEEFQPLLHPLQCAGLIQWIESDRPETESETSDRVVLSVAEALDKHYGTRWAKVVVDEISKWCAAYYDAGQSAWRLPWRHLPLFAAWKQASLHDVSPEIQGINGFRQTIGNLPETSTEAITVAMQKLGIAEADAGDYLHRLFMSLPGWSAYVQYQVREQSMRDRKDESLLDLLAILLTFEAALCQQYDDLKWRNEWSESLQTGGSPSVANVFPMLWQMAFENAFQRQLLGNLASAALAAEKMPSAPRPTVQAVFCIDVRSEVMRRSLESVSSTVETLGFAGFFGMPIEHVGLGQPHGSAQCPVLLTPKWRVRDRLKNASAAQEEHWLATQHLGRRIRHSWNAFKTSAVSCFSFVEAAGLGFGWSLVRDAFLADSTGSACRPVASAPCIAPARQPCRQGVNAPDEGIDLADQVKLAEGALKNMGLTSNFARFVLLCGHGSTTNNNPYSAGLDCGACGGHAGDTNARVAAAICNNPEVREALIGKGIFVPTDTYFLAGLHNTTTDDITLFDMEEVPASHRTELQQLQTILEQASITTRKERAPLLGLDQTPDVALPRQLRQRSKDWAQVRPEWGLAGNAAFIAAPRSRTQSLNLEGRVFLHTYDHKADEDNGTLSLIMAAPMVVANWINLQYYASTVNNAQFGSGSKVTHNVLGTFGICQGNGGDLQTGLPLQSLHDGDKWVHEPLRLTVLIEAPRARMSQVIAAHQHVRHLVTNGWLHLIAIEEDGRSYYRHLPDLTWQHVALAIH